MSATDTDNDRGAAAVPITALEPAGALAELVASVDVPAGVPLALIFTGCACSRPRRVASPAAAS